MFNVTLTVILDVVTVVSTFGGSGAAAKEMTKRKRVDYLNICFAVRT